MKRFLQLKSWLPSVVFTFVVYCVPFLFAFGAYNEDASKRIGVNLLFFAIASCAILLQKGKVRKTLLAVLSALAIVPNIVVLAFLVMDKTIMKSTDFWVIFDTNISEASGFLTTLPISSIVWCAIYILLFIGSLIWAWKNDPQLSIHWCIRAFAILVLLCIMVILPFRAKVPSVDFYKSFLNYQKEKIEVRDFYEKRKELILDVQSLLPQGKKTIVIAIGESHNRNHMQIYGYPRQTNPLLSEIQNELAVYTDVCSPAIQTLNCMKEILTFTNYENPKMYKQEASIVELAKAGGYTTYWADNQGSGHGAFTIDTYTPTSYRTIAHLCDYYTDENASPHDSMIISRLQVYLKDTAENKVIFLHLIGSHFPYCEHSEAEFKNFTDCNVPSKFRSDLDTKQIAILNDYDNSMLYNDFILRQIIEALRKEDGMSAFLYFSDHGEEVFDSQLYAGRSFEKISPSMCQIPLILWQNEAYKNANCLSIDTARPACTDDVIYGIMDILGIRYSLYDSSASIFNHNYKPKTRMVQGLLYEDIVNKFN